MAEHGIVPAARQPGRGHRADGGELARLDTELDEIDLLVPQARNEATRHEARRAAGADKVTEALAAVRPVEPDPAVAADLNAHSSC